MIHPDAASAYYPLLKGALSGLEFMQEPEPENAVPFLVSAKNSKVIPFSDPHELYYREDDDQLIFVTSLRGTVLKHDAACGPMGTRTLASRMKKMDSDKQVIGHILLTESGGGQAAGVPEMADALQSLTKPVVAWIDGMSASAAYYINSYCNHIMASRTTDQVGCIGALIQIQGFPKYAKLDDGSIVARIYADGATEKNDEWEKALEGNFTLMKERVLNPLNEQFVADVKTNRSGVKDEQLKGRTYNAGDVVGSLIDSIGSFEDAVQKVISLAKPERKEKKSNQNNSKQMGELTNLNNIQSINGFEVVEGQASFNEDQLREIEAALENGRLATERVTQLEAENTTLKGTVSAHETTIQANNSRIAELEAALNNNQAADDSAIIVTETDGGQPKEKANNLSEAFKTCETHLKQFS